MPKKMRNLYIFFGVIVLVLIDRITKVWAVHALASGSSISVIPGVQWTLAFNRGIAWSHFQSLEVWAHRGLIAFIVLLTLGIGWALFFQMPRRTLDTLGYTLVLSGAISNLWDRYTWGAVVDFIDIFYKHWHWPVFNVADSLICIGIASLLLSMYKDSKKIW